jgi:serine protease Do
MHNRLRIWFLVILQSTFVIAFAAGVNAQSKLDQSPPASVVDLLQLEEDGVKAAVKRVSVSVVQIETIGGNADDAGVSTGTVVSADGLVLTAAYNLRHKPANIFVMAIAADGKDPQRFIAELLATDNSRNLCLLKVDLPEDVRLVPAIAADQDGLLIGETAIAAGKVHDSSAASISVGIISATDRIWGRAVQTDAKISRSNYGGPLLNLSGETIGVLVPLSPDDGSIEAGSQWYDSGIGFAIPLQSYYDSVDRMATGSDLDQGLLGITLSGEDLYSDLLEIKFCAFRSPATQCGLKPGDTIVAMEGLSVNSQAQMKHVLGPKYAGDSVDITVMRGDQEKKLTATLTDKIEPFVELAIGIIPDRSGDQRTATIGHVFPSSPAAKSELVPGDIISAINTKEVNHWDDFQTAINQLGDGETVEIVVRNESADNPSPAQTKTIELAPLSATMPSLDSLEVPQKDGGRPKGSLLTMPIKVAGSANLCTAFLPDTDGRKSQAGHPLFVWVAQPGDLDVKEMEKTVSSVVTRHGVVVLVPQSINPQGWSPEETEFIVKAVGKVKNQIKIDEGRVAIGGERTAAKMSSLAAMLHRDTFGGLIMFDSLFPRRIPKIQTRPDQRLMILLAASADFKPVDKLDKMKTVFEQRKFPVSLMKLEDQTQGQTLAKMLPQVAAWIHALDRH